MFAKLLFCAVALPICTCFILDTFFGKAPSTVPVLDLDKYLGRWFQMYASQSVVALWEQGAVCVTADYLLNIFLIVNKVFKKGGPDQLARHGRGCTFSEIVEDPFSLDVDCIVIMCELSNVGDTKGDNGRVTVLNSERLNNANGSLKVIHGYAENSGEPGKFSVHLEGVPVGANYWVLKLGPATYGSSGQYQYAVVSDQIRGTLFVLARDPDVFRSDYDNEVTKFLEADGFTSFYNNRVVTYHGKDCIYNGDHQ